MVQTRFVLILFFSMVTRKAACHAPTLSGALLVQQDVIGYFSHRIQRLKICPVVLPGSEPILFFSNYLSGLGFKPV